MAKRIRLTKSQKRRKGMKTSPEETSFSLNDGTNIRNLMQLAEAMGSISHETYSHHVNEERNDFSAWIRDVLGEKILAKNLVEVSDKTNAQITILKHLVKNLS